MMYKVEHLYKEDVKAIKSFDSGFIHVLAKGFEGLFFALDAAARQGLLSGAIADAWDGFDFYPIRGGDEKTK